MRRTTGVLLSAIVVVFAVSLLSSVFVGCGGGDGGADRTGRLQVAITDQTGTYASVVLSIRELRLVQLGQGDGATQAGLPVIPIPNPPHVVDVIQLAYQHELLGGATVPAGRYQQVRLVLDPNEPGQPPANYLTLAADPGTEIPINTPSGQTSGLKVLGRFEVAAGQMNTIMLDFDPEKAIVQVGASGKYNFKPTGIRIIEMTGLPTNYGAIVGVVDPETAWPSAVVEIIPDGATEPFASGSVSPDNGSFRAVVPAGAYMVRVTATGFETLDSGPHEVFDQEDTDVGTLALTASP